MVLVLRPQWPRTRGELAHILVAGLLMHATNLCGSHYAQYLGMCAGVTALVLAAQPPLSVVARAGCASASPRANGGRRPGPRRRGPGRLAQDRHPRHQPGSLTAVGVSLAAITAGTLYQRVFCPRVDLNGAALLQFAMSLAVLAPLAWAVEGMHVRWAWQLLRRSRSWSSSPPSSR